MNKFKIGDIVKIKKLSEEKVIEIYHKNYRNSLNYYQYIKKYKKYFNKIGKIIGKNLDSYRIEFLDKYNIYPVFLYPGELEKVYDIKTKINFIKDLITIP